MQAIHNKTTDSTKKSSKLKPSKSSSQLFVGGLAPDVTEKHMREFFKNFGSLIECRIMKYEDQNSRGFGFITFDDDDSAYRVLKLESIYLKGKKIECKLAMSKKKAKVNSSKEVLKKIFLRGLSPYTSESTISDFFNHHFGEVANTRIIYEHGTLVSRGFAFVKFVDQSVAERAISTNPLVIEGHTIHCELALSKEEITKNGMVDQIPSFSQDRNSRRKEDKSETSNESQSFKHITRSAQFFSAEVSPKVSVSNYKFRVSLQKGSLQAHRYYESNLKGPNLAPHQGLNFIDSSRKRIHLS